ncbi:MAG: V-type ATPase 116kDa subunit family protein, partial [Candidatus Cloacimonadota bacterium]
MRRYSFVLYHLEYESFLGSLQDLGVLHIERSKEVDSPGLRQNQQILTEYNEMLRYLASVSDTDDPIKTTSLPTKALYNKIMQAREEQDNLKRHLDVLRKQIHDLEPWGYFDYKLVETLKAKGIGVDFRSCLKNHFKEEWEESYSITRITERSGVQYFVLLYSGEKPQIEADIFSFHQHSLQEYKNQYKVTEEKLQGVHEYLVNNKALAIELFTKELERVSRSYEYEEALELADNEASDHLKLLHGWVPASKETALLDYLKNSSVVWFASDATLEENPPILLKNNAFNRLYETISKMYMLPLYNEFDLTPFFAPFFMLFFGFCNADIAYGLVIILLALFLKKKAKNQSMRVFMNMVITFGVASFVMGILFGSFLGYDTVGIPGLKDMILTKGETKNDQIFNLALLIGAIQILFGVMINTIKQIVQSGFKYGLAPFGTFLFLLALAILGSTQLGVEPSALHSYAKYPLYVGLALILLFNNPKKNVVINVLGGLWLLYNVVTGFFGDILSYIRLFALGVSSAILGFVINEIGKTILGEHPGVISYIIFPIFMLLGHTLNLALGSLGAFVHPMRLTFVEFFKNAGFNGPG